MMSMHIGRFDALHASAAAAGLHFAAACIAGFYPRVAHA
jgi:hypothetical protein